MQMGYKPTNKSKINGLKAYISNISPCPVYNYFVIHLTNGLLGQGMGWNATVLCGAVSYGFPKACC